MTALTILTALAGAATGTLTTRTILRRRQRAAQAAVERWRAAVDAAEPVAWSRPVPDAPLPPVGFGQCLDCGAVTTGGPLCDRCAS